jgi:hypothetical protein
MKLQVLLPMELFGGADADHFAMNLSTEQAEMLLANLSDALDEVYEIEDHTAPPLNLFKLSINSNN